MCVFMVSNLSIEKYILIHNYVVSMWVLVIVCVLAQSGQLCSGLCVVWIDLHCSGEQLYRRALVSLLRLQLTCSRNIVMQYGLHIQYIMMY